MKDLTEKLTHFVNSYNEEKPLTLQLVAKANDCSVDQVRRRVGDLVKAKKETFKKTVKKSALKKANNQNTKIDDSILIKIMSRLDKIEGKLNSILSDEWIENTGDAPPEDRLCKAVYGDGKIITALSKDLNWQTYEIYMYDIVSDLESAFMKECKDKGFEMAVNETYKLFPDLKGRDLFFDGGWSYSFETEEDRRFRDAVYRRIELQGVIEDKIYDEGIEEYKNKRIEKPDPSLFIVKYKIMDDSNSRVIDKLNLLGRKIDNLN